MTSVPKSPSMEEGGELPELPSRWNLKTAKRNAQISFLHSISKLYGNSGSRSLKVPTEQPQVLVGPVIGKVTSTTARVLIEIDKTGSLTIELKEKMLEKQPSFLPRQLTGGRRGPAKFSKSKSSSRDHPKLALFVTANRPSVFEFKGLKPGTSYTVEVKSCIVMVASSFRTFPEVPADTLSFGVISCNKIFITDMLIAPAWDLWSHLSKSIEAGKVDFLLHLGDQVKSRLRVIVHFGMKLLSKVPGFFQIYGDGDKRQDADISSEIAGDKDAWSDRFQRGMEQLKDVPSDQWINHQDVICGYYREVYRDTWRHLPTAKCLANCPSLMIYDDHEVRDNWGDNTDDWNRSSAEFFVARCAWIVSLEYQRQLYEDVDFEKVKDICQDYHFHVVGGVGLIFLDIRGSRTFHRDNDDDKKYLGNLQWNAITKALSSDGIFGNIRALLVCSPAPLVFLEPGFTKKLAVAFNRLEDFKGHWSYGDHINEQLKMIDALNVWKTSEVGREVLVLGGDVHCGGHSDIIKDRKVLFRQLTTSAIANRPLPKSAYYFMRAAGRLGRLPQDYGFRHYKWTRSRNYGLVQVKHHNPQDNERTVEPPDVEVSAQLVKCNLSMPVYADKVTNLNNDTGMSCLSCTPTPRSQT